MDTTKAILSEFVVLVSKMWKLGNERPLCPVYSITSTAFTVWLSVTQPSDI